MFVWTFLLRIAHTIISQSSADSSWITLYTHTYMRILRNKRRYLTRPNVRRTLYIHFSKWSDITGSVLIQTSIKHSPFLLQTCLLNSRWYSFQLPSEQPLKFVHRASATAHRHYAASFEVTRPTAVFRLPDSDRQQRRLSWASSMFAFRFHYLTLLPLFNNNSSK